MAEHGYLLARIEGMQRAGFSEREIGDFVRRSVGATEESEPRSGLFRVSSGLLAVVRRYGARSA